MNQMARAKPVKCTSHYILKKEEMFRSLTSGSSYTTNHIKSHSHPEDALLHPLPPFTAETPQNAFCQWTVTTQILFLDTLSYNHNT